MGEGEDTDHHVKGLKKKYVDGERGNPEEIRRTAEAVYLTGKGGIVANGNKEPADAISHAITQHNTKQNQTKTKQNKTKQKQKHKQKQEQKPNAKTKTETKKQNRNQAKTQTKPTPKPKPKTKPKPKPKPKSKKTKQKLSYTNLN